MLHRAASPKRQIKYAHYGRTLASNRVRYATRGLPGGGNQLGDLLWFSLRAASAKHFAAPDANHHSARRKISVLTLPLRQRRTRQRHLERDLPAAGCGDSIETLPAVPPFDHVPTKSIQR